MGTREYMIYKIKVGKEIGVYFSGHMLNSDRVIFHTDMYSFNPHPQSCCEMMQSNTFINLIVSIYGNLKHM